jgi:hypothetical protein
MARKVFFTIVALLLAGNAFDNADPHPDINLFGVLFLFFAFIAWFCWDDILAGYAYQDESGTPLRHHRTLMFTRVAPMMHLTGRRERGRR